MKIAIIAPPWRTLPAHKSAGIESTITDLCEEFHSMNQDTLLFAPRGSSVTSPIEHYPYNRSKTNFHDYDEDTRNYIKQILTKYASVKAVNLGADIIHNFTLSGEYENPVPSLHTVYGPPSEKTVKEIKNISHKPSNYFVSVCDYQKVLFSRISPSINFIDTVYKSINTEKIEWTSKKNNYLLFMGYHQHFKELQLASRVSKAAGIRLVAIMQKDNRQTYKEEIKPWLKSKTINLSLQFSEELLPEARYDMYKKAAATIHINHWDDPFGMQMLESLACGTPVIALKKGAASEVIKNGMNGYIASTELELIEALKNIDKINRKNCRKSVETKFSSKVIAKKYLQIYKNILNGKILDQ